MIIAESDQCFEENKIGNGTENNYGATLNNLIEEVRFEPTADFKKVTATVRSGKTTPGTERGGCERPRAGHCEGQEGVQHGCSGQ